MLLSFQARGLDIYKSSKIHSGPLVRRYFRNARQVRQGVEVPWRLHAPRGSEAHGVRAASAKREGLSGEAFPSLPLFVRAGRLTDRHRARPCWGPTSGVWRRRNAKVILLVQLIPKVEEATRQHPTLLAFRDAAERRLPSAPDDSSVRAAQCVVGLRHPQQGRGRVPAEGVGVRDCTSTLRNENLALAP
eukprot:scaffold1474_cov256-Pinguiococcus_pyrenoidosus.AAC.20